MHVLLTNSFAVIPHKVLDIYALLDPDCYPIEVV